LKEKSPAVQWYPKQALGDDKIIAMDWDAKGMHYTLCWLSWQQEPPGTIPGDAALIRRWLGLSPDATDIPSSDPGRKDHSPVCRCPDCVWRRVSPQLYAAWPAADRTTHPEQSDLWGRRVNAGMFRAGEKQRAFSEARSKAANARWKPPPDDAYASPNAYGMHKPCESTEDEDKGFKKKKKFMISHWDGKTAPPDDSTIDDLAPEILNLLGIGLAAATRNAVTEALRLKSSQVGWTIPTAFVHICNRGLEYRQSPKFKSEFKTSWVNWMLEGGYDAPESWNGNGKVHTTENGQKIDRGYIPLRKAEA
jgi:hypothetical protein